MTRRPLLEVRISEPAYVPSLTALCAGYELGRWRAKELARDVFRRHLLSWVLPHSQFSAVDAASAADDVQRAAERVYKTEKYGNRGEFGELLLHAIIRDVYNSEPAITKLIFKDAANDTVKGFDAVHVVEMGTELELWLGEVKFYTDIRKATRDVIAEIEDHLKPEYLRGEFLAITDKIDPNWPHRDRVLRLLDPNTSLDEVFDALTVPILLSYDSTVTASNSSVCEAYIKDLTIEVKSAWEYFVETYKLNLDVRVRLILLPLASKKELMTAMHERLRSWQNV